MAWPEISIDDFPPERDDEPSSLRQDIIDELSDHFACALNRELLKNPDEQTAKQRVLNEFGDPLKIARQLWLDAMKEKIMSQRIMTGISAVMAVCSLAVVGIVWMLMKDSQTFNLQMLEQIKQSQRAVGEGAINEMYHISFQLLEESEEGKPAIDFTGELTKKGTETREDEFVLEVVSDKTGKLDFGKLPWGKYSLSLRAPWDEVTSQTINMIPGRDHSQSIICPAPPEDVSVKLEVNWRGELKEEKWYLLCDFRNISADQYGQYTRSLISSNRIDKHDWYFSQKQRGVYLISSENQVFPCPLGQQGEILNIDPESLVDQASIEMVQGDYVLTVGYLVRRDDLKRLSLLNLPTSYKVINFDGELKSINALAFSFISRPFSRFGNTTVIAPFNTMTRASIPVQNPYEPVTEPLPSDQNPAGYQTIVLPFSAVKTQNSFPFENAKNLWEINLPDLDMISSETGSLNKSF